MIKSYFESHLAEALNLLRVSAPIIVRGDSGINDNLDGIQKPVSFPVRSLDGTQAEIVQSLAKWKRMALADYGFSPGEGLYTDMNAIRPDETITDIHSIYVDQWDWELAMTPEQRNLSFLMGVVRRIYEVIHRTERHVAEIWPELKPSLPPDIQFITSEELLNRYPDLPRQEREHRICQEWGAVFIIGIGAVLSDGKRHDDRAPDYDDWTTPTERGEGLNGDIFVWNPVLERDFELSSMGIRVDIESLKRQLALTNTEDRMQLPFHQRLLGGELPQCIGGGIGQSRLCMYMLQKAHIGEVQSSIWPEDLRQRLKQQNVPLL
jgi:aspartate--ammonia ligase